jgi:hypothetical protein
LYYTERCIISIYKMGSSGVVSLWGCGGGKETGGKVGILVDVAGLAAAELGGTFFGICIRRLFVEEGNFNNQFYRAQRGVELRGISSHIDSA